MINLSNTTLVSIDGVGKDSNHLKALKYSCNGIKFGDVKFFCNTNFGKSDFYSHVEIPKLTYDGYNKFCLVDLVKHIDTEFVIIVQDDGFITHSDKWNPDYQQYDYIGAPWPKEHLFFNTQRWPFVHEKLIESNNTFHIGNGGFCMRSKKLMTDVSSLMNLDYSGIPEDVLICIGFRKQLEEKNHKFASFDLAKTFSCESLFVNGIYTNPNKTFGFHGKDTHMLEVMRLNNIEL